MKIVSKMSKTILLISLIILSCSSVAIAQIIDFDIVQVTENNLTDKYPDDYLPVINDAGDTMWNNNSTVLLRNGENTFQYDPGLGYAGLGFYIQDENSINESGEMVWSASAPDGHSPVLYNVYMYDGNNVIQITDNSDDNRRPIINESGQICWYSSKGVYLYDGGNVIYLGAGYRPQLNDLGQVVWASPNGLMFYDGELINKINDQVPGYPRINNNGYIVWDVYGGSGSIPKVYLYDGNNILYIGDGLLPVINENNQAAWIYQYNSPASLYFYSNNVTVKLSGVAGCYVGRTFALNDKGHLAWHGWHNEYIDKYNRKVYGSGIYFYDGLDISTVIGPEIPGFPGSAKGALDINNNDEIVWGYRDDEGDLEVYLAKPVISNTPPVFDPISPQSALEGDQLEFTVAAIDGDADNIYLAAVDLPLGATFDQATGLFSWVPDNSQSGTYSISIIATDDGIPSMSSEIIVNINIIDVPTPEELINTTITELLVLDLPTQDFNSYMANLKKVEDLINEGNYIVAINQLNAFIKKVEQDMSHNGSITADGAYFIGLANNLLELIRNM